MIKGERVSMERGCGIFVDYSIAIASKLAPTGDLR
ncbi:hypothetical protein QFZ84_003326 [Pseudomonas fluorescens]